MCALVKAKGMGEFNLNWPRLTQPWSLFSTFQAFSNQILLLVCSTTLWVGQLDKKTQQSDVMSLLEEFGQIASINVSWDVHIKDTCNLCDLDVTKNCLWSSAFFLFRWFLQGVVLTLSWFTGKMPTQPWTNLVGGRTKSIRSLWRYFDSSKSCFHSTFIVVLFYLL